MNACRYCPRPLTTDQERRHGMCDNCHSDGMADHDLQGMDG